MRKGACICGCGDIGVNQHHAITQAVIKRAVPVPSKSRQRVMTPKDRAVAVGAQARWLHDRRNLVPTAFLCHQNHHAGSARFRLDMLPDSVFVFAVELLGPGLAYETLRRAYQGDDARLDLLLESADAGTASRPMEGL